MPSLKVVPLVWAGIRRKRNRAVLMQIAIAWALFNGHVVSPAGL
jgi:hypothetical protein